MTWWRLDRYIGDHVIGSVLLMFQSLQEVCQLYWPSSDMIRIGEYTVELLEEKMKEEFIIRRFSIFKTEVLLLF